MTKKICVPPREDHIKDAKYEGAYVKEPRLGMQKWVVSFDINSLYPSVIRAMNMSPETIAGQLRPDLTDELIGGRISEGRKTGAKTYNGAMFKRDSQGFLPEMIEKIYKDRVIYKKRELKAQKEYQKNPTNELKKEIAFS